MCDLHKPPKRLPRELPIRDHSPTSFNNFGEHRGSEIRAEAFLFFDLLWKSLTIPFEILTFAVEIDTIVFEILTIPCEILTIDFVLCLSRVLREVWEGGWGKRGKDLKRGEAACVLQQQQYLQVSKLVLL